MTSLSINKIVFIFCFLSVNFYSQVIINYTPDNHLRSILQLSKKMNFLYGLDNQSVDYYKVINNNYSIFYNLESETFSLKDDETNFILDRLELFKIKELKHNDRTLTKLNSTLKDYHYKSISTSFSSRIKQVSNTVYNYGLVRTSIDISLLQIYVDTIQLKLTYKLIPIYDNKFSYFPKKNKSDSVFSFSLFEGTVNQLFYFKHDIIIKVSANPTLINGKYDFSNTYFSSQKPNALRQFNKLRGTILDVLDNDTILTINKDSSSVYYYNGSYNFQYQRKIILDSNIAKMELIQQELLTDPLTSSKFVHLKFKKDSLIDVFYSLNNLNKCIYKITSTDFFNNIAIRGNSILVDIIHLIDKHIYVYQLIKNINQNTTNNLTLLFHTKTSLKQENKNPSLCASQRRSLFYDKIFKTNKKYILDSYELLDKNKVNVIIDKSEICIEPKQETLSQLIESIINFNTNKCYSDILSQLFIYKKNTSDTLIYKMINEQKFDDIKHGINDIAEQLKKASDIPQKEDFDKNNCEIELYTSDGSVMTLVKFKRKWYCTTSYYKQMD